MTGYTSIFSSVINTYLPEPHASLLNGIVFGESIRASKEFYLQLQKAGILHVVVLSGTNITILSSIIAGLTSKLGKQVSCVISILMIILFILFVNPQAPIVRAGFMGSLTLVSIIFGRKNIALHSLLISFIFILIFFPAWIKTLSLQLSYGATLGIILFYKKSNSYIFDELRTSIAAQVFTAPLIFFHFKSVSLVSPISNLLISCLIAPLMLLGFIIAILGKINWYLGLIPSLIAYGMLSYMTFVIRILSELPFAFFKF